MISVSMSFVEGNVVSLVFLHKSSPSTVEETSHVNFKLNDCFCFFGTKLIGKRTVATVAVG